MRSTWYSIFAAFSVASAVVIYRAYAGELTQIGGVGWVDQNRFERDIRSQPDMGKPYAKNLVVHSDLDVDVVEFDELDPTTLTYRAVKFASPHLSHGSVAALNAHASDQILATSAAPISYRLISSQARWMTTVFIATSVAVISGIAATLLRRGKKRVLIDVRAPVVPDLILENHLEAADPELISMSDGGKPAICAVTPAPALDQQPVLTPDQADANQEYAGEYYPVARPPHGFSLVELTVSVAILAILVAVLLPAMTAARRQAQTVQCATQLRQIADALHAYANNNGGSLPACSGWHTWPRGLSEDFSGPAWTVELMPYLQAPDGPIYICPSLPQPYRFRSYFLAARWSAASHRHAMKFSDLTKAGRFVLAGDKTQLSLYPKPFGSNVNSADDSDPDDAGDGAPVLGWPWQRGGFYMHRRGNNVLFDDGHVATMAQFDPQAMTFNPRRVEDWDEVTPD